MRTKEDVVEEFRKQTICDAAMRVVARKGINDVTVQKKAQEADMLRKREAMQRQFVAQVSHEMRTPLAVIKGYAESLQIGRASCRERV